MQCVFMVTDLFCGLFPLLASAALNLVKQFAQNCTVHQFSRFRCVGKVISYLKTGLH